MGRTLRDYSAGMGSGGIRRHDGSERMTFDDLQTEFSKDPAYKELMDCGKRISDTFALHRLADPIGNLGKFFAVRLQDGTTNNDLYPSMDAARGEISKRDDENRWMYIQVIPSTLSERDAAIMLRT